MMEAQLDILMQKLWMNKLRQDNDEGLNNEPPEELSESFVRMVETSTPI